MRFFSVLCSLALLLAVIFHNSACSKESANTPVVPETAVSALQTAVIIAPPQKTGSNVSVDIAPFNELLESLEEPPAPKTQVVHEVLSPAQEILNLAQYKGKVVYLDFWASWCVPCKQSFPWMQKMQQKYPDDLVVIAVNLDEKMALAEQFLAKREVDFRIVYDQLWQIGREYEIFGLPYSFIYNRSGELVGTHAGFTTGDDINLENALNNLFALGE